MLQKHNEGWASLTNFRDARGCRAAKHAAAELRQLPDEAAADFRRKDVGSSSEGQIGDAAFTGYID